ncbi:MAG TPA: hypothetical protein VGM64_17555 [Lacunisphaera sp.]|jgi:hypothetical protein
MNARAKPPGNATLSSMPLRTYLRFLRPLRSLFVISIVTFCSRGLFEVLWHCDETHATVLALIVFLPVLLGDAIAGAAHEPMHRPFILLLPESRQRLRRVTVAAIIVAAFAVTCVVSLADATIPPFAIFGFAIGLIAYPCINRHRRILDPEKYVSALCLGTIFWLVAVGILPVVLSAAPWAFLLGGSAVAAASVAWGFSHRHVRERSTTPFVSMQTLLCSYSFQSAMSAGRSGELPPFRAKPRGKNVIPGSLCKIRTVGSSTFAWMQVVWHALFGPYISGSLLKIFLFFFGLSVLGGAILPAFISSLNFITHHAAPTNYWEILASLTATKTEALALGMTYHQSGDLPVFVIIYQLVLSLHILRRAMKPPFALPISRARITRVTFGLNLIQMLIAFATPTAAIFCLSLIGQIVSGEHLSAFGLPNLMATALLLAIVFPLVTLSHTFRRPITSLCWSLIVWILVCGAMGARAAWGPHLLTWPGVFIATLLIAANVGLLWHRLTRQFATCDLTFDRTVFTR